MTDHRAKGQRVPEMVHSLKAIKADFVLVYFWVSVCMLVLR